MLISAVVFVLTFLFVVSVAAGCVAAELRQVLRYRRAAARVFDRESGR